MATVSSFHPFESHITKRNYVNDRREDYDSWKGRKRSREGEWRGERKRRHESLCERRWENNSEIHRRESNIDSRPRWESNSERPRWERFGSKIIWDGDKNRRRSRNMSPINRCRVPDKSPERSYRRTKEGRSVEEREHGSLSRRITFHPMKQRFQERWTPKRKNQEKKITRRDSLEDGEIDSTDGMYSHCAPRERNMVLENNIVRGDKIDDSIKQRDWHDNAHIKQQNDNRHGTKTERFKEFQHDQPRSRNNDDGVGQYQFLGTRSFMVSSESVLHDKHTKFSPKSHHSEIKRGSKDKTSDLEDGELSESALNDTTFEQSNDKGKSRAQSPRRNKHLEDEVLPETLSQINSTKLYNNSAMYISENKDTGNDNDQIKDSRYSNQAKHCSLIKGSICHERNELVAKNEEGGSGNEVKGRELSESNHQANISKINIHNIAMLKESAKIKSRNDFVQNPYPTKNVLQPKTNSLEGDDGRKATSTQLDYKIHFKQTEDDSQIQSISRLKTMEQVTNNASENSKLVFEQKSILNDCVQTEPESKTTPYDNSLCRIDNTFHSREDLVKELLRDSLKLSLKDNDKKVHDTSHQTFGDIPRGPIECIERNRPGKQDDVKQREPLSFEKSPTQKSCNLISDNSRHSYHVRKKPLKKRFYPEESKLILFDNDKSNVGSHTSCIQSIIDHGKVRTQQKISTEPSSSQTPNLKIEHSANTTPVETTNNKEIVVTLCNSESVPMQRQPTQHEPDIVNAEKEGVFSKIVPFQQLDTCGASCLHHKMQRAAQQQRLETFSEDQKLKKNKPKVTPTDVQASSNEKSSHKHLKKSSYYHTLEKKHDIQEEIQLEVLQGRLHKEESGKKKVSKVVATYERTLKKISSPDYLCRTAEDQSLPVVKKQSKKNKVLNSIKISPNVERNLRLRIIIPPHLRPHHTPTTNPQSHTVSSTPHLTESSSMTQSHTENEFKHGSLSEISSTANSIATDETSDDKSNSSSMLSTDKDEILDDGFQSLPKDTTTDTSETNNFRKGSSKKVIITPPTEPDEGLINEATDALSTSEEEWSENDDTKSPLSSKHNYNDLINMSSSAKNTPDVKNIQQLSGASSSSSSSEEEWSENNHTLSPSSRNPNHNDVINVSASLKIAPGVKNAEQISDTSSSSEEEWSENNYTESLLSSKPTSAKLAPGVKNVEQIGDASSSSSSEEEWSENDHIQSPSQLKSKPNHNNLIDVSTSVKSAPGVKQIEQLNGESSSSEEEWSLSDHTLSPLSSKPTSVKSAPDVKNVEQIINSSSSSEEKWSENDHTQSKMNGVFIEQPATSRTGSNAKDVNQVYDASSTSEEEWSETKDIKPKLNHKSKGLKTKIDKSHRADTVIELRNKPNENLTKENNDVSSTSEEEWSENDQIQEPTTRKIERAQDSIRSVDKNPRFLSTDTSSKKELSDSDIPRFLNEAGPYFPQQITKKKSSKKKKSRKSLSRKYFERDKPNELKTRYKPSLFTKCNTSCKFPKAAKSVCSKSRENEHNTSTIARVDKFKDRGRKINKLLASKHDPLDCSCPKNVSKKEKRCREYGSSTKQDVKNNAMNKSRHFHSIKSSNSCSSNRSKTDDLFHMTSSSSESDLSPDDIDNPLPTKKVLERKKTMKQIDRRIPTDLAPRKPKEIRLSPTASTSGSCRRPEIEELFDMTSTSSESDLSAEESDASSFQSYADASDYDRDYDYESQSSTPSSCSCSETDCSCNEYETDDESLDHTRPQISKAKAEHLTAYKLWQKLLAKEKKIASSLSSSNSFEKSYVLQKLKMIKEQRLKMERVSSVSSGHWVRRSVRTPCLSALNAPNTILLLERLKINDPDMVVLKLKKYIGPDSPQIVIDAVLGALMENENCQALYVQNFNEGLHDKQLMNLLRVLQVRKNIWCLNIGETYNVRTRTWEKFAKGLKRTHITHLYASEHTISAELKDSMREIIRDNRKKHDKHINPTNLDVIIQCTHCWWNPINAKKLRPYLKEAGKEYLLFDRVGQGLPSPEEIKNTTKAWNVGHDV